MFLPLKRASISSITLILLITFLPGVGQVSRAGVVHAAAPMQVTLLTDQFGSVGGGGAGCSLREAVYAINNRLSSSNGCLGGNLTTTITLPPGTYHLTIAGAGEDLSKTGDLDIRRSMTITGAGAATTTVLAEATPNDRIFHVQSPGTTPIQVTISGLTLSKGNVTEVKGGGAVLNERARLGLEDVVIKGNRSGTYGGGVTTLRDSVLSISGSTISGNHAGYGGGVYSEGLITIENTTIQENTADTIGGGINSNPFNPSRDYLYIIGSTIAGNQTGGNSAGVISSGSLTIKTSKIENNGGTGLTIDAGSNAAVFYSQITSNQSISSGSGNGIESHGSLSLFYSTIEKNASIGLLVTDGSTAVIEGTTVNSNAKDGLKVETGSTAQVTNSTISANLIGMTSTGGNFNLLAVTVADNQSGGIRMIAGEARVNGTILARNSGANCILLGGTVNSLSDFNLQDNAAQECPFVAENNHTGNPGLEAGVADHGGTTKTYEISSGSPAVDAIPANSPFCLGIDQRWFGRPAGIGCDIGAFEAGAAAVVVQFNYLPLVFR